MPITLDGSSLKIEKLVAIAGCHRIQRVEADLALLFVRSVAGCTVFAEDGVRIHTPFRG